MTFRPDLPPIPTQVSAVDRSDDLATSVSGIGGTHRHSLILSSSAPSVARSRVPSWSLPAMRVSAWFLPPPDRQPGRFRADRLAGWVADVPGSGLLRLAL
jgi:hypothetical protein